MRSALTTIAVVLLLSACGQSPEPTNNDTAAIEASMPTKGVDRSHRGQPGPDATFQDPDGGDISLAEFEGTPVLVNLGHWCAPCVKELPTIDALARTHGRDGALGVVAVSQDLGPQGSVEAFLQKLKVDDLGAYHDPKMALSGALNAQVLPTTVLLDAEGKEVWRYVGDLDGPGEEARKLLAELPADAKR